LAADAVPPDEVYSPIVYAIDPTALLLSPDPQPIAYRVSVEETVIGDE
jgi:hypothetical protein